MNRTITSSRRAELLDYVHRFKNVTLRPTGFLRSLFQLFEAPHEETGTVRFLTQGEAEAQDQRLGEGVMSPLLRRASYSWVWDVQNKAIIKGDARWRAAGRNLVVADGPADWIWSEARELLTERSSVMRGPLLVDVPDFSTLVSALPELYDPLVTENIGRMVTAKVQRRISEIVAEDKVAMLLPNRGLDSFVFLGPEWRLQDLMTAALDSAQLSLNLYSENPPMS